MRVCRAPGICLAVILCAFASSLVMQAQTSAPMAAESQPTFDVLLNFMEYHLQRTTIDKTGLTGKYDVNLTWSLDRDTTPDASAAATDTAPSLFTAIEEQLGLKLQPGKGPVDTLLVDHIEEPSEN